MVKRSILQLYRSTIFLAHLWMAASHYLFNKCNQKIRQVKNQIITHQTASEKAGLKQLDFGKSCLILTNCCSMHVVLGELQVPNAFQDRFEVSSFVTRMNADQSGVCFFVIIYRSLEIKHSLKMWLNNTSWRVIFADFPKTAEK